MERLIKQYIKKDDPEILHDLRISARKMLSRLETEGKSDESLKKLLKKSSKLRDTDVLSTICKNKKAKKYLKKKHKKLRRKFIEFLKNFSLKTTTFSQKPTKYIDCGKILKESFLEKDDKELHKIRLQIKKCRYTQPEKEKIYKKLQDALGKMHDFYNCEKLLKKLGENPKRAVKKKLKWIKRAEKARLKALNS